MQQGWQQFGRKITKKSTLVELEQYLVLNEIFRY